MQTCTDLLFVTIQSDHTSKREILSLFALETLYLGSKSEKSLWLFLQSDWWVVQSPRDQPATISSPQLSC